MQEILPDPIILLGRERGEMRLGSIVDLEGRISAKLGPEVWVLVIKKRYVESDPISYGHHDIPGRRYIVAPVRDHFRWSLNTRIYLGILPQNGPFSQRDDKFLNILVPKHALSRDHHDPVLREGPIAIEWLEVPANPDIPIYSPDELWRHAQEFAEKHENQKPDYPLDIIVGYEKVQEYCAERGLESFFLRAAKLLGLAQDYLVLFTPMKAWFKKTREEIVEKLLTGARVGYSFRQTLQRALELDMHVMPGVYTPADRYWMTIDVPVFIRDLAQKQKLLP